MKSGLIVSAVVIVLMATIFSCQSNPGKPVGIVTERNDSVLVASHSFKTKDGGWGYIITVGEKIVIKQPIIPVVQGNKSFATEEDALKVAALVVNKIKSRQKPTIFRAELQKIGIIE